MASLATKQKNILLIAGLGAFVLIFRVFSNGVFFLDNLYECFLSALVGLWGISTWWRITDRRCGRLFFLLAGAMLLWLVLKAIKYHHIYEVTALRYMWYGYYLPFLAIPLLSFYISVYMMREERKQSLGKWCWLMLPAAVLSVCVMTNDLHTMVFSFPQGADRSESIYYYEWGFYLVMGYIFALSIAALVMIFKKCSLPQCRQYIYVPIIILAAALVFSVLYGCGIQLRICHVVLLRMPDMICLVVIAIWESCIQIGLFPVNSGYGKIFRVSGISAQLVDDHGEVVYSAREELELDDEVRNRAAEGAVMLNEDTRLHRRSVYGGSLYYTEDLSSINRLQAELTEAREVIADENKLIEEENLLKEENIRYRTLNRIYDEIAVQVHGQVLKIEELLRDDDKDELAFRMDLAEACFLNVYIKRRSNLIIQGKQYDKLDVTELFLSVQESLNYLTLCGKNCFVKNGEGDMELPAHMLFTAYDFFENLVEQNFDHLTAMMVDICADETSLTLRILMNMTAPLQLIAQSAGEVTVYEDEDGIVLVLRVGEDGGAA